MIANSNTSKFRTYFSKLLYNLLSTLSNLHKFNPALYSHDNCNRCHLTAETNNHLWECSRSQIAIKTILSQSTTKLQKLLKTHFSNHNQILITDLITDINNFCNTSYFLNNASFSTNIDHKPGYLQVFKGFVVKELTDYFKSLNIPSILASKLSAKFTIWFAKQGFTLIWLARCKHQVAIEKSNSIFTKQKRIHKKRTGHPTGTTNSASSINIFKTHLEPNLCRCKFSRILHTNNLCPDEGLANMQGDEITSLVYSLQAENDLFINPIGFS